MLYSQRLFIRPIIVVLAYETGTDIKQHSHPVSDRRYMQLSNHIAKLETSV